MRGVLSVSGVIGMWAGPRSAGTAYVMLHHHVGDAVDGQTGAWGFARGGMGAISNAIASAAQALGAEIRTERRSPGSTPGTAGSPASRWQTARRSRRRPWSRRRTRRSRSWT